MGQFDYMFDRQNKAVAKRDEAQSIKAFQKGLQSSLAGAVKPLGDDQRDAYKALKSDLSRLEGAIDKYDTVSVNAFKAVKSSIEALQGMDEKVISYLDEALEGLEAVIKAEIKAIPQPPKPEKLDISPVLEALKALPEPVLVQPEQKRQWTFDIKRNRTTGLIESIEAK